MYSWARSGPNASHNCFPSVRRNANTDARPSLYAVVRKIRSPQTIGEEWPRPVTLVRQRMFCLSDQVSMYPESDATPWPDGPRQRDQNFAAAASTPIMRTD